jgi:hypothetical protein
MASWVVSVENASPTRSFVCWDPNTNLPRFTFERPDGVSFTEAEALKERADICCGGTLRIVRIND